MNITEIDKNFALPSNVEREGAVFYSIDDEPFRIYGVFREGDRYVRLPKAVRSRVSDGVDVLGSNTAGGRVRFCTDSPYIILRSKLPSVCKMSHMAYSGIMGMDMYEECDGVEKYTYTLVPQGGVESTREIFGVRDFPDRRMRTITLNLPLYNDLSELHIGVASDASVTRAPDYKQECPIVYYGSSVTQGGCASRPGMSYQAILTRMLSADHINLGFSGSARGESLMAEYISGLCMSAFVMDYDYNAPNAEHLERTHKPFFDIIRQANPTLPIIMLTRPCNKNYEEDDRRREIITATYEAARAEGDENVYFIDGRELIPPEIGCDGTVDGAHPTDLGFYCMAKRIYKTLEKIIER